MAPQLRPILRWACAAYGLRYPHADKRRGVSQSMPAASWSRLWRSLRPYGREYRLIRARRWPPWVWYVAPRVVGL